MNFATKRQSELRKLGEGSPVVFSSSPRTDFAEHSRKDFLPIYRRAGAPIAAEKQTTAAPRIDPPSGLPNLGGRAALEHLSNAGPSRKRRVVGK